MRVFGDKCVDSRVLPSGARARRYKSRDGRVVHTIEIPLAALWPEVSDSYLQQVVESYRRVDDTKERQQRIRSAVSNGVKIADIARAEGVTWARVHQIRKKMESENVSGR